jgi:hypothetical protein
MTDTAERMRAALAKASERKTTQETPAPPPRRRRANPSPLRQADGTPAPVAPVARVAKALARAGEPMGKRPTGRENYPVQKKFLLDRPRHSWLVRTAHACGPGVGYVALLRAAIGLLDADPDLLAALRDHIAAREPSGRDRGTTITLNLTDAQSKWLRAAAHRTGEDGISQHQLVHAIIDWVGERPDVLDTIRGRLPAMD